MKEIRMGLWEILTGNTGKESAGGASNEKAPSTPLDPHGQPLNRALNEARLVDRGIDELVGLCKGVLADGEVTQGEAQALLDWMESNRRVSRSWPASVLYPRIKRALADGVLDADEQGELLELLLKVTGGEVQFAAPAPNLSMSLPVDDPPPPIAFSGEVFCFTGRFITGTRNFCEGLATELGGEVKKAPSGAIDFLVIGSVGSDAWIHSTHGRKIEKAVELRERGAGIAIVTEQHWVAEVERARTDARG